MRVRWLLMALALMAMLPLAVQADPEPVAGKTFVQDGVVTTVDTDRDLVIFQGGDGQRYTLDTTDSDVAAKDGSRADMADLSPGMRVYVSGKLLSADVVEALHLRVLGSASASSPPKAPVATLPAPSSLDDPNAITLRGTVSKIDLPLGAFVVKVKDHTRTILMADDTDLSGLGKIDPQAFPVKLGDRVTVAGALQPDGTVLAGALSYNRDIPFPAPAVPTHERVLVGQISSTSDRYTSRDIKILLADGREVKVKVPRGIPIRRDGQPVSVHDLHSDEAVRVTGSYDGADFRATRIEAVSTPPNPAPSGLGRL